MNIYLVENYKLEKYRNIEYNIERVKICFYNLLNYKNLWICWHIYNIAVSEVAILIYS